MILKLRIMQRQTAHIRQRFRRHRPARGFAAAVLAALASAVAPAVASARAPLIKTLAAAHRTLTKAHCRLGAIHRSGHHDGTLYVGAQGAPAGKRLAHNARIALWLSTGQGTKRTSHR
jgi:hypothetical protein